MITAVIRAVIRWRAIVWLLVAAGVLFSAYSIRTASLDAIPDISDPQIIVYVKWARSPQLLETEVTEPLASALVGSPGIRAIRGSSHMGYAFIYVVLNSDSRRDDVQKLVVDTNQRDPAAAPGRRVDHARTQRQQHGLDLSVRPDRSRRARTICVSCGC